MKTLLSNHMGRPTITLTLLLMVSFAMPVMAADSYGENTAEKATRGGANILTGWLEVPKQIYQASREYNVLVGITFGTVNGVAHTVARTGAGVYETGTFLIPAPPDYEPVMEPEYVWNEWNDK